MVAGTVKGFAESSTGSELFTILRDPRRGRMATPWRKLLWAILVLCFACGFAAPVLGVHRSPLAEQGEAIFQKNCSACHTVGGGRSAGPDLAGVTARRDRAWLTRIITAPGALLDSGDPVARKLLEEFRGLRMPDLGITPKETDAILSYLAEESASPATAVQTHPSAGGERPLAGGEPEAGKSMFFGTARFRNGGAACSACHAISGLPGGGGMLGPDLSRTYADYGEEGITPVLAAFPFPSMKPIYDARPLTPEEQSHIKAFLRVSAEGEPAGEKGGFLLLGLGGFLLVTGLAHIVWRKRLSEVRRPLLRRASRPGRGDG
jgi:mono/diheme cytochrome c family protein